MNTHELQTICQICQKECEYLGSHIVKAHKMTAREYKHKFNLDYKFPLISPKVKLKKQLAFEEHKQKYLNNLKTKTALTNRFKKGHNNTRTYISEQSKQRILTNLELMNYQEKRQGTCPICKTNYNHIESHMYNKHGLLVNNRDKFYQSN